MSESQTQTSNEKLEEVELAVAKILEKEPDLNGSITLHFQNGDLKKKETRVVEKI